MEPSRKKEKKKPRNFRLPSILHRHLCVDKVLTFKTGGIHKIKTNLKKKEEKRKAKRIKQNSIHTLHTYKNYMYSLLRIDSVNTSLGPLSTIRPRIDLLQSMGGGVFSVENSPRLLLWHLQMIQGLYFSLSRNHNSTRVTFQPSAPFFCACTSKPQ